MAHRVGETAACLWGNSGVPGIGVQQGFNKVPPVGQIQPTACSCMVRELKMILRF